MLKKTSPPTARVRTLEEADPAYRSLKELVARLRAGLSKLDIEESELLYRLSNRPHSVEITTSVARLLGDELPDGNNADGANVRLKAIAAERVDLRRAVDVAQQRLTAARFGASASICRDVSPIYAERVKALASAFITAHRAHEELLTLIDELNAADVSWTGTMAPLQADRILGHQSGKITGWLAEAVAGGFISKTDIPKDLQQ